MMNQQVEVEEILKSMRETIANQAQEIAVLKATITAMQKETTES